MSVIIQSIEEYRTAMAELRTLAELDPPMIGEQGERLGELSEAAEVWERAAFPYLFPECPADDWRTYFEAAWLAVPARCRVKAFIAAEKDDPEELEYTHLVHAVRIMADEIARLEKEVQALRAVAPGQ